MKTFQFGESYISSGNLILVNPSHPLPDKKKMDRLTFLDSSFSCHGQSASDGEEICATAESDRAGSVAMESQAAEMLLEVMMQLNAGDRILPVSGYRTLQEQQMIYADSLRENGAEYTSRYVAIPGCSEHQTGLAIDLAENREEIDFICPDFPDAGICRQFRQLSASYGFIERYPAGREQITQIACEPWHFRYVGYPHSEIIKEMNDTLEEYIQYLKCFCPDHPLGFQCGRYAYEIFYVPVPRDPGQQAVVEIPDQVSCQASGNNEDGVVVTLRRDVL